MPIVDFSTYTLNNDNAECGFVLVLDCTEWNFVFKNPCELLTGCSLDLNDYIDWDTFDRCKMVESPLLVGMTAGNILRVNATGTCIEWVPLTTLITSALFDYKVKVTAGDTPDYLSAKIVWTTNRITVTQIPGQALKIDIAAAFQNSILPANPTCIDPTYNPTGYATLVYDTASGVHRECQQNRWDSYWYQRYLQSDIVITTGNPWFPAGWSIGWACYWFVNATGWDGLASMAHTYVPTLADGFAAPMVWLNVPAIEIEETWIYAVRANVDFSITWANSSIVAIRFFVYSNNSKVMLLNMKEANEPNDLVPAGSTNMTRSFSWYNQVYLKKWEYIFLGTRVYTPDPAKVFTLTIKSQALDLLAPYPTNPAWKLSGTTYGCSLVSKSIQDSS